MKMFSSKFLAKVVAVLLIFWIGVIFIISRSILYNGDQEEHVMRRLTQALNDLDLLKKQNDELRNLISDFRQTTDVKSKGNAFKNLETKTKDAKHLLNNAGQPKGIEGQTHAPSQQQANLHRLIRDDVKETMYFFRSEVNKLRRLMTSSADTDALDNFVQGIKERQRATLIDIEHLRSMYNDWRSKEAAELSKIVQNRLHKLQNPKDCSKAKKLICRLDKGCGYGCQIHHVIYCFIVAYGTERTLILKSQHWRYASKGWESIFKPVSETCTSDEGISQSAWPGSDGTQVINLPTVDVLSPRPKQLPLSLPSDISDRLIRLHGDPFVWWTGQFVKYVLRPQEHIRKYLDDALVKLEFKSPIVGVHIRRTDKIGTEAAFHGIEEYMEHVEDYFDMLEMKEEVAVRRVYLATDDASVLADAKKRYPKYLFIGDNNIAKSASLNSRYNDRSLLGIILDIHALANCDYLVCTFSSQVCRLAYEVMQYLHADASHRFHSLDDIYYFGGQNAHNQVARYNHFPRSDEEIALRKGDVVGIAGNHWNGYSKGENKRLQKVGLYPSFKTVEQVNVVDFPSYSVDS